MESSKIKAPKRCIIRFKPLFPAAVCPNAAARAAPGNALATFDSLTALVGGDFAAAYATPILVGTIALTIVGSIVQTRTE